MSGLDITGFTKKEFDEILEDIQEYQQSHVSSGLTRNALSIIGSQNTAIAQELSLLWEAAQDTYSAQSRSGAEGAGLRDICELGGVYLTTPTKTVVTATVTLNPGKALPAGSVASIEGRDDLRFFSLEEVPSSVEGGDFDVDFEAEYAGSIVVEAGQLSEIAVAVSGWVAVTNALAGVTGAHEETDEELRIKSENTQNLRGSSNVDAIQARIFSVDGVTDARVTENCSDRADSLLTPGHTIWCVVAGGSDSLVAQAIFDSKSAGINTRGGHLSNVTDTQGHVHAIRFDHATEIDLIIEINVSINPDADETGVITAIKQAVYLYANSLLMGSTLYLVRLGCLVLTVEGVDEVGDILIDSVAEDYTLGPTEKFDIETSDVLVINEAV
jgi:uncharacterized phage protein gp47/JayE